MKKLFIFVLIADLVLAQKIFEIPLSPRIADYDIWVKVDDNSKKLYGYEILKWKNTSPDIINELHFHLYLNAFKNINSTFMIESGGQHRGIENDLNKKNKWGWIDIDSIGNSSQGDLTDNIDFIHPDDDNENDQTVARVRLNKPILPNQEIELKIKFTAKLPKIFARTGFAKDFYLVGQWFPKIGVYEYPGIRDAKVGSWNCHQFHSNSEFYADYGVYHVRITLPSKFIVGAVGNLIEKKKNSNGTTTHYFRAEDVVDFAFTASSRYKVFHDQWKHVKIELLIQPEHLGQVQRHFVSVKHAMNFFEKKLGSYPYPNLTIVDPPMYAQGAGGMEYPTFITAGSFWGMPQGINFTEMVTIHEFGHNYFMDILASNEFEEAFLDEGFNQYFETRIMDKFYGRKNSFFNLSGINIGDYEMTRSGYTYQTNPKLAQINIKSWDFKHGGYGVNTYNKTAVVLKTLENLLGEKTMNEIMRTYYSRWKFKHPSFSDFISIANGISKKNSGNKYGDNLNWYFEQTFNSTNVCDYKIASISNNELNWKLGIYDSAGTKKFSGQNDKKKKQYEAKVILHRLGEIILPVEVLVKFSDGSTKTENWSGEERSKEFKYVGKKKIKSVHIDPMQKISMDVNLINNSLSVEKDSRTSIKFTAKIIFWFENLMLFFAGLF